VARVRGRHRGLAGAARAQPRQGRLLVGRRTGCRIRRRRRPSPRPVAAPAKKAKLSYKEQRELDELPAKMAALEVEQKTLEAALASTELYTQPKQKIAETQARFAKIDEELLAMLERWEELGKK
jgi:hypothetical protein